MSVCIQSGLSRIVLCEDQSRPISNLYVCAQSIEAVNSQNAGSNDCSLSLCSSQILECSTVSSRYLIAQGLVRCRERNGLVNNTSRYNDLNSLRYITVVSDDSVCEVTLNLCCSVRNLFTIYGKGCAVHIKAILILYRQLFIEAAAILGDRKYTIVDSIGCIRIRNIYRIICRKLYTVIQRKNLCPAFLLRRLRLVAVLQSCLGNHCTVLPYSYICCALRTVGI